MERKLFHIESQSVVLTLTTLFFSLRSCFIFSIFLKTIYAKSFAYFVHSDQVISDFDSSSGRHKLMILHTTPCPPSGNK